MGQVERGRWKELGNQGLHQEAESIGNEGRVVGWWEETGKQAAVNKE